MRNISFRTIVVSMIVAGLFVPLYAHHGTQFLSKAMEMNAAEVRLGEMAANKTQNPRVKDFAQMVVRDHNQTLDKIREIRDARQASPTSAKGIDRNSKNDANVQLTPEHQRTLDKLSALSGAEFDRQFMDVMVREHRLAIRDFENQTHVHGNTISTNRQTGTTSGQTTAREKPGTSNQPRQKPATGDQGKYSRSDLRRDVDTVDFANATLPALRNHLQQAEQIQKELQTK